jgi:hypothetical protein
MIEEKCKVALEVDIVNLCNKLSEPSRSYLLDTYVRLNFEYFSRVFFAYMTGCINGREEVTAMWEKSQQRNCGNH